MAAVAALTLLIAAHLDATERRAELATLVAVGASRWTILGALLVRSAAVAGVGAAVGALAGSLIAAAQEPSIRDVGPSTWALAAFVAGAGALVGMIAAVPTAFACDARDPVRELQEG
jgi:ABC-type antimicrobial peptide transport system permease subunit